MSKEELQQELADLSQDEQKHIVNIAQALQTQKQGEQA